MGRTITRRSLLLAMGSLALTQWVSACRLWQKPPEFMVEFLASSIPAILLKKFQAQIKHQAKFKPIPISQWSDGVLVLGPTASGWVPSLTRSIAERLPFGPKPEAVDPLPHIISLGDAWLRDVIQSQQITPIDVTQLANWPLLPLPFQQMVTRDQHGLLVANGQIWGAPYRWGHLMIAYRADQETAMAGALTDWQDLWRPELKRRISLLDHERVVLGIALKTLGQSINQVQLDAVPGLADTLADLHQQVKFYSSDNYLQPLLLEDTWVAVGWSMDILPLVRRDRRIKAVVPTSGSILTADVWVQPVQPEGVEGNFSKNGNADGNANGNPDGNPDGNANGEHKSHGSTSPHDIITQWIDFFWTPAVATEFSLLSAGASPVVLSDQLNTTLPAVLLEDRLLLPSAEIMDNSEFLEPLTADAMTRYQDYWTTMRTESAF